MGLLPIDLIYSQKTRFTLKNIIYCQKTCFFRYKQVILVFVTLVTDNCYIQKCIWRYLINFGLLAIIILIVIFYCSFKLCKCLKNKIFFTLYCFILRTENSTFKLNEKFKMRKYVQEIYVHILSIVENFGNNNLVQLYAEKLAKAKYNYVHILPIIENFGHNTLIQQHMEKLTTAKYSCFHIKFLSPYIYSSSVLES